MHYSHSANNSNKISIKAPVKKSVNAYNDFNYVNIFIHRLHEEI